MTSEQQIATLRAIALGLAGRLDQALIDDAMEYIGFNELPLAIETLCDHLSDHHVTLRDEEVRTLMAVALAAGADPDRADFLRALVQ